MINRLFKNSSKKLFFLFSLLIFLLVVASGQIAGAQSAAECKIDGKVTFNIPRNEKDEVDPDQPSLVNFKVTGGCVGRILEIQIGGIYPGLGKKSIYAVKHRVDTLNYSILFQTGERACFPSDENDKVVCSNFIKIIDQHTLRTISSTENNPQKTFCNGECNTDWEIKSINGKDPDDSGCSILPENQTKIVTSFSGTTGNKATQTPSLNQECVPSAFYAFAWMNKVRPVVNDFQVIAKIQADSDFMSIPWEIIDTETTRDFFVRYVNVTDISGLPVAYQRAGTEGYELSRPYIQILTEELVGGVVLAGKGQSFDEEKKGPSVDTSDPCYDEDTGEIKKNCYGFLAPLPGIDQIESGQGFSTYINVVVKLVIKIASLIAVIIIVISGIQTMTTEVLSEKIAARQKIQSALVGLLIALGVFLILDTINPDLTNIKIKLANDTLYGGSSGGYNPTGSGHCVAPLIGMCSVNSLKESFPKHTETMSKICQRESGGASSAKSGVDLCAINGIDRSDGTEPFSIGLFQINLLSHADKIPADKIKDEDGCSGLIYINKGACLEEKLVNNIKICALWSCEGILQDGEILKRFQECSKKLEDVSLNTKIAYSISNGGSDISPWRVSARLCGLKEDQK